jgi:hypothetical protein
MAEKVLTGTYSSGYELSAAYTGLDVKSSAYIGGAGITAPAYASIVNHGRVIAGSTGNPAGIDLTSGGLVVNRKLIEGYIGIYAGSGGPTTVTNFATIGGTSGVAVDFKSAKDRLIVESGAVFGGAVLGGGGALELAAGAGTLAGLGTAFGDFSAYQVDGGGDWTIEAANSVADGATLTVAGTLGCAGSLTNDGSFLVSGLLANSGMIVNGYGGPSPGDTNRTSINVTGTGADLSNTGVIVGGVGAVGAHYRHGFRDGGGLGGTAVLLHDGILFNSGTIVGGQGGQGGANRNGAVGSGGLGGVGVYMAGATVMNMGTIEGGRGGLDGSGHYYGSPGIGVSGAGVIINGSPTDHYALIGGVAATTVINYGEMLDVSAGRLVEEPGSDTVFLQGGGTLELAAGAGGLKLDDYHFASYLVDPGASWTVEGNVRNLPIYYADGALTVAQGGSLSVTGYEIFHGAIDNDGVFATQPGSHVAVDTAVSGAGAVVVNGGTLTFQSSFSQDVAFGGTAGDLILWEPSDFAGAIAGFSTTGTTVIDLAYLESVSGQATYSGTTRKGVLTDVTQNATIKLHLTGDYLGAAFNVASDGQDGVIVTATTPAAKAPSSDALVAAMARMGSTAVESVHGLAGPPHRLTPLLAAGHGLPP